MKKAPLAMFIVASLLISASASTFAGDFVITDITNATVDQQIASKKMNGVRMGQIDAPVTARFGTVSPFVSSNTTDGMKHLVQSVSPETKIMVFRDAASYEPLSETALAVGATTKQRINNTKVFGVQNALNDAGLRITPEQYLTAVGIKVTNDAGNLLTETEVLGNTFAHLQPRLQPGGDLFDATGGKYALPQQEAA